MISKTMKEYPMKSKNAEYMTKYYKKYPWKKHRNLAMGRVKTSPNYIGLEFSLTINEVKEIWIRDNAYDLNRPSIDRKNPNKGYTYQNCQFIELSKNISKSAKEKHIKYRLLKKAGFIPDRGCIVQKCKREHHTWGMCKGHHQQFRKSILSEYFKQT